MSLYLRAVLVACAVGAGGTALGASGALAVHAPKKTLSAVLLGLAGGVVIALGLLDMIPESYELGGPVPFGIGLAAGAGIMAYVAAKTHQHHAHGTNEDEAHLIARRSLMKTGLLLAAGMAVHNLPQGIAIGSGIEADYITSTAVLLFLHNIPEGMAMAIPLRIGEVPVRRIYAVALLTAIPVVAGAVLGVAVASISEALIAGSMAFAAGAMLYLALRELIPQSAALGQIGWVVLAVAAGYAAGWGIVWMLD